MKRLFRLFLLSILCCFLFGCNQKQQSDENKQPEENQPQEIQQKGGLVDIENNNSASDVSTTAKIPPKKSVITTQKLERQLLNQDSTATLLRGEYKYPQVENMGSFSSIDKINSDIKKNTEEKFEKAFKEGGEYVKEFYGNEGASSKRLPFVTEQTFKVAKNQDFIVSFKISTYDDFGGAHPNIMQDAYTYDVRTGEKLPASHFIGNSEEEVKQLVAQTFYTVVLEQPDAFYSNAGDILSNGQFDFGFYIQEDAIVFFINPYIIAPNAAGVQETSILIRQ